MHYVTGRLVKRLEDGLKGAGNYTLRWDLRDSGGRKVSQGVYFVRVVLPPRVRLTKKFVVLR